MDPSTLENGSKILELKLDFWGLLLLGATLFVVIGLVLEYWHEISEFIELVRRPAAAFPWQELPKLIGAILVTIGVAGELFCTYKASRVESRLRDNNHSIIELLKNKASEDEREAAQLRKDAQDEQLARVHIEQGLAWRTLSPKDSKALSTQLKRFSGQTVIIAYEVGNAESSAFAWEIASVLNKAQWNVFNPNGIEGLSPAGIPFKSGFVPHTGIGISRGLGSDRAGKALINALVGCGFDAEAIPPARALLINEISIFVATRPRGPQGEAKLHPH
jgi:hypothetical protein